MLTRGTCSSTGGIGSRPRPGPCGHLDLAPLRNCRLAIKLCLEITEQPFEQRRRTMGSGQMNGGDLPRSEQRAVWNELDTVRLA